MVQSQLYLGAGCGVPPMSMLLAADPDFVTFNGYANQYTCAKPGERGFVEFTPAAPGTYTIIDHRLADAQRGAVGTLVADP